MPSKTKNPITRPHTDKRVKQLVNAGTHGANFKAMVEAHLTSDDFSKSFELTEWKQKIKELQNEKDMFFFKEESGGGHQGYSHLGNPFFQPMIMEGSNAR